MNNECDLLYYNLNVTIYLKMVLQLNDSVWQFTLNAFINYSVSKLNVRIDLETVNLTIYAKNNPKFYTRIFL